MISLDKLPRERHEIPLYLGPANVHLPDGSIYPATVTYIHTPQLGHDHPDSVIIRMSKVLIAPPPVALKATGESNVYMAYLHLQNIGFGAYITSHVFKDSDDDFVGIAVHDPNGYYLRVRWSRIIGRWSTNDNSNLRTLRGLRVSFDDTAQFIFCGHNRPTMTDDEVITCRSAHDRFQECIHLATIPQLQACLQNQNPFKEVNDKCVTQ